MRVRVGTSGYAYKEWKGTFYPEELPADAMLSHYASRFDTVEINNTFYRMPNARTIAAWAEAVPAGFTFVLKASQKITHVARLQGADDAVRYFCDTALGMGAKLGPLLFQLPPNFKKDLDRLRGFLPAVSQEVRCVFEFRHDSWFAPDTYDLLRSRNVGLCVADTETGTTPLEATADFGYLRLRDEGYTSEDLARWAGRVRELGARGHWSEVYVFFKHEESGKGPALAQEFRALFG
ncbi:MAG TPA: DUF72 domain-containing protein [Gemmatimonadales bacterium]|nr:DUF72 domain-containing protein [Gemmatimonadales bacterium]